jgi:uncharacterized protein (DUF4415 family)
MKKVAAEKYRDIDFSRARRGPVVKPEPGKTKISIRLDNTVLKYFRDLVDKAGGGNYQTLINDARRWTSCEKWCEKNSRRTVSGAV